MIFVIKLEQLYILYYTLHYILYYNWNDVAN